MVEQASNKTKNTSYSARQGVSQGQKPYTQTTFFSLRKFPFPRSTVRRTVWGELLIYTKTKVTYIYTTMVKKIYKSQQK